MATTTITPSDLDATNATEFINYLNFKVFVSLTPTVCYILLVALAGLFGNTVVFLVYYRRFKPTTTRTFILVISVCDLVTNLFSVSEVVELRYIHFLEEVWVCRLTWTIKSFFTAMSAGVLVAIAMDRCRRICFPNSRPKILKKIRVIIVVCAVLALCISLPYAILNGRHRVDYPDTNVTIFICNTDDVYMNSISLKIFNGCRDTLFSVYFLVMIVSYVRIAHTLWKHKQNRAKVADGEVSEKVKANGSRVNLKTGPETPGKGHNPDVSCQSLEEESNGFTEIVVSGEASHLHSNYDKDRSATEPSNGPKNSDPRSTDDDSRFEIHTQAITTDESNQPSKVRAPIITGNHSSSEGLATGSPGELDHKPANDSSFEGHAPSDSSFECDDKPVNVSTDTMESVLEEGGQHDTIKTTDLTEQSGLKDNSPKIFAPEASEQEPNRNTTTELSVPTTYVKPRNTLPMIFPYICSKKKGNKDSNQANHRVTADANDCNPGRKTVSLGYKASFLDRVSRIRREQKHPKSMSASTFSTGSVRKIPTRTTLMMFILTVIFIVSYLPVLAVESWRAKMESVHEVLDSNVFHIFVRSFLINSVINPVVYSFCCAKFRLECRRLFNCKAVRFLPRGRRVENFKKRYPTV